MTRADDFQRTAPSGIPPNAVTSVIRSRSVRQVPCHHFTGSVQRPSSAHRKYLPRIRDTSQFPSATVVKLEIGAKDEIMHRTRDQNLACARETGNPCGDVHRDTTNFMGSQLDLPGVQTYANRHAIFGESVT
jgi:hypothetical protein